MSTDKTMMAIRHRFRGLPIWAAVAGLMLVGNAYAQEGTGPTRRAGGAGADIDGNFNNGWAIGLDAEYSDNILRSPDGEGASSYGGYVNFDFGVSQRRWNFAAASDLSYRTYTYEGIPDQLDGGARATFDLDLIGDYLRVSVDDSYGQTRTRSDEPDSPMNRSDLNILSAGATLEIPLGNKTRVFAEDSWSLTDYEDETLNYGSNSLSGGLRQMLSESTSIFLRGVRNRVEFDSDPLINNYDIEEAMIGIQAELSKTSVDISGGTTRVKMQTQESSSQLLLRASVTRRLGARTGVTLSGGTEYSDYAQTAARQQQVIGVDRGTSDVVADADPFKSDYAMLALNWTGVRYEVSASGGWRRERREGDDSVDRSFNFYDAGVTRIFSPLASLALSGSYSTSPRGDGTSNVDWGARLGMNLRLWRTVVVEPYVAHYAGDAGSIDYKENRYGISVGYSPQRN